MTELEDDVLTLALSSWFIVRDIVSGEFGRLTCETQPRPRLDVVSARHLPALGYSLSLQFLFWLPSLQVTTGGAEKKADGFYQHELIHFRCPSSVQKVFDTAHAPEDWSTDAAMFGNTIPLKDSSCIICALRSSPV